MQANRDVLSEILYCQRIRGWFEYNV